MFENNKKTSKKKFKALAGGREAAKKIIKRSVYGYC
jgi:hypothetical protein